MTDNTALEIQKKLLLILGQCHPDPAFYSYLSEDFSVPQVRMDFSKKGIRVEAIESLPSFKLNNEHIDLLRAFYQTHDDHGKWIIVEACSRAVFSTVGSAEAFFFLARYHSFEYAIRIVAETPPSHFLQVASTTIPALSQILRFDHLFIPREHLESLCPRLTTALAPTKLKGTVDTNAVRRTTSYSVTETLQLQRFEPIEQLVKFVCEQATRIQYLRLKKELQESANFEVNQDRDRLVGNLNSLGFSAQLTEFLKFAENEFAKARDAFSYKSCVDQVRSFFAELLNETAEKVATGRGETLASVGVDTKYPVQVREYLESAGFLSPQFRTLVDGLYKFMSDEGTHTLGATKEVARIARNIAIEIGLLVTKRLQQRKAAMKS